MAKKDNPKLNYAGELKRLDEQGPERLYMISGPEDYLRECYLEELRKKCGVQEGDFSFRRIAGPIPDWTMLAEAVDALPFFSERSFVEVRDMDASRCRDEDLARLKQIISDVPDYCTLVFVFSAGAEPDGRTAAVRALKKAAYTLEFTEQEQGALCRWVQNRFRTLGKSVSPSDAEYLIFLCGTHMNGLIPEIEKISAYAKETQIRRTDIDATADRLPEADVFTMTDLISRRRFDAAASVLSDLLSDKSNHPIMLNALIGRQLRNMYAVKVGQTAGRSRSELMELSGARFDFVLDKLIAAAKPYSEKELGFLVEMSAEYDYRMKSTGQDPEELLRELFARIAAVT